VHTIAEFGLPRLAFVAVDVFVSICQPTRERSGMNGDRGRGRVRGEQGGGIDCGLLRA